MLNLLANGKTKAEILHPSIIRTDGGTQMRAELNAAMIDEYAQSMREGATFPPIVVYYDGEVYWLGDGFHRLAARKKLFEGTIECEVRSGTRRDAVLCAAGANASHGLRRTNADKRRAVEALLRDEEWAAWSDREIARRCGVHHELVGRMRAELSGGIRQMEEGLDSSTRTVQRNGQTYTQNVSKISSANQERRETGQSELSAKIHKLEVWLIGKGWGMSRGPGMPTSINKGEHRFEWNRDDEQAHFSALKNAETIQLAISNLDRQIDHLSKSLIAAGWGILSAPPPSQSYVSTHKTNERFNFDRADRQSLLDALTKAANAEKLYQLRHAFDEADPTTTAVDPLANDERIQDDDGDADEILDVDSVDQRLFDAKLILAGLNRLLDKDLRRYEELTGKMFDTPPVKRNLYPMRAELLKLIEILEQ